MVMITQDKVVIMAKDGTIDTEIISIKALPYFGEERSTKRISSLKLFLLHNLKKSQVLMSLTARGAFYICKSTSCG